MNLPEMFGTLLVVIACATVAIVWAVKSNKKDD